MARKIFKTGNSMVVSIPKNILEQLGISEGQEVAVELDKENAQIVIRPEMPVISGVDEQFAQQLDQFIDNYRSALEKLAE